MNGSLEQTAASGDGPSAVAAIADKLRDRAGRLHSRGVQALWVFGSVARGEADSRSDIDLLAEFDPQTPISLVTLASLRAELSELLGAPADLVERGSLEAGVRAAAERDAVRVL